MLRQRVSADYLQTAAVIEPDGLVRSAVNDPNAYLGPGTGYRLEGERWELLQALPHVVDPRTPRAPRAGEAADPRGAGHRGGRATTRPRSSSRVGPAFADGLRETIDGLAHGDVLAAVLDGVREAAARRALVRVRRVGRRRVHRPRRRPALRARASRSGSSRRARP